MLRYIAPAGAPIGFGDLVRWARLTASSASPEERLVRDLQVRLGVAHCVLTSTGRAGLTLLLRAARRLASADRDEVVLPSYTCYSVAASVVKAGLRPRIADVSVETLDYDATALDQVDCRRVLAIIATNLYGMPNDLPRLSHWARQRDILLIDDAAQALGASIGGRPCGTWGDAGLYSFDKGKNVTAIDGGVLVTNSDALASALGVETATWSSPRRQVAHVVKAVAYAILLRPWLYGIPTRIPQLGLGKTVFTTDFPVAPADPGLTALAAIMLGRLESFTRVRTRHARALLESLAGVAGLRTIPPLPGATPAYLRLPVLFESRRRRDAAVQALNAKGIGATASYPTSLADVPELRGAVVCGAAAGREVAECIATLPTHPFVQDDDIERMADTLRALP